MKHQFFIKKKRHRPPIKIHPLPLVASGLILILLFAFSLWLLPTPVLGNVHELIVYDSSDEALLSTDQNSINYYVKLDELSDYVIPSFVSIEDKRFFDHVGVDWIRIIKAAWSNISADDIVEGASTITQQYAKNIYFSNTQSWERKIQEIIMALRIEGHYSKEQILEGYLNTLYFGGSIYGIGNAAWYFFNTSPADLSLAQSAMLAGIINAPAIYSPQYHEAAAKDRQSLVLYAMVQQSVISIDEYYEAMSEPLYYTFSIPDSPSSEAFYRDEVISELKELGLWTANNRNRGLLVDTYYNRSLNQSIDSLLESITLKDNQEISIVVMRSDTNQVISLIGGKDYSSNSYQRATKSSRMIGSTIKPLLYYLALSNGFTPTTKLLSEETTFVIRGVGTYAPNNANHSYAEHPITMIEALALSDNIYAVKTGLLLGSDTLAASLKTFGVTAKAVPSLAIGTAEMSPLQLTSIYHTFASVGVYYKPELIERVRLSDGTLLYESKTKSERLLDLTSTIMMNQMMRSTFDLNTIDYMAPAMLSYQTTHPFAAKTGTTERDSWVMGFNPLYTIGIWIGCDEGNIESTPARYLFQQIANNVMEGEPNYWYEPTRYIESKKIDPVTGLESSEGSYYYFRKRVKSG